ncbi:MAG: ribulokinase [Planctomycetota bacterium]
MAQAALGLDFGTASVRAVVVDVLRGRELGAAVTPYAHGVMDRRVPGVRGTLPPDWALQQPQDYLDGLRQAVRGALRAARTKPERVCGIGVDFTACTALPTCSDGTPLCYKTAINRIPNAYVKLWKHHAAQAQADALNRLARERRETWLKHYGAGVSCEWLIPKAHQVADESPEVYDAADLWLEAGDWVVGQLTGVYKRNACAAGYKGCYVAGRGDLSPDFLRALHPKLEHLPSKLPREVVPAGTRVGGLNAEWAHALGLKEGTPVGAAIIDAHAAVPASGLAAPGEMALILGTSFCHMLLGAGDARDDCAGISGSVRDGILPGLMGYEAGQAGGGDLWAWCVDACGNAALLKEARAAKRSVHEELARRAAKYRPGATGVLALDWHNGNRSPLNRPDLSGLLVGLTLSTPPEAIYRALQESLAFGTRTIVENFERQGLPVNRIVCSGGIAHKDPPFLQMLADVTGREIEVARSSQACGVGASILGAIAAGPDGGGHADFASAARAMGGVRARRYRPSKDAAKIYTELFAGYTELSDHFGRGGSELMGRLKAWRKP